MNDFPFMVAMAMKYLAMILIAASAGFYAGTPVTMDLCTGPVPYESQHLPSTPGKVHEMKPLLVA